MKGRQQTDVLKGKSDLILKTVAVAIVAMFAVVCLVLLNADSSSAESEGGQFGDLTWEYDGDHTLTITGTGEMPSKPLDGNFPWVFHYRYATTIVIGDGVTSVADEAFSYCPELAELTLGNSVRTIGDRAFYSAGLTSLTLPNSLVSIGEEAFYDSEITSLVIPDSVTSIGAYAFDTQGDAGIGTLTLGSSVVTIGEKAFQNADFVTLVIPNSVKSIGDYAFGYTTSMTSLTLGSSLETIGDYAFIGAPITSLVIPDSVKSIGEGAFKNAPIEALTLGSSLETIGESAFAGLCITELVIPDSVVTIAPNAFYNNQFLSSLTLGNSVTEIGLQAFYRNDITTLTIPDSVVAIGQSAFSTTDITTLTVGKGLMDLHGEAFLNSRYLTSVTIDAENPYFKAVDNVIYSKDGTKLYYYPEGIEAESFTFPDGVTELSNQIHNDKLNSVVLCADLTTLCEHPFEKKSIEVSVAPGNESFSIADGCLLSADGKNLKYVFGSTEGTFNVPEGVVEIEPFALYYRDGMTEVVLPDSVTTIGTYAFGYASDLATVSGGNVTRIGDTAFAGCERLTSFEFAEEIESIGDAAFSNTGFTTLALVGAEDATIGVQAFASTEHLTSLNISGGFAIGDYAFHRAGYNGGEPLSVSVTLGSGIVYIGDNAFEAVKISSLVIPDTVTGIGDYAFDGAGITSLTIGEGVASIGYFAFMGCNVTELHFNAVSCGDFDSDLYLGWSTEAAITVEFGEGVERIPGHFASRDEGLNIASIELPASVKEVGEYAFNMCSALETFVMSSDLKTIGNGAFSGCTGISTIIIPKSVTSIGSEAFYGCTGLTSVTYNAANCEIEYSGHLPFQNSGAEGGMAVTFGDSVKTIPQNLFKSSNAGPEIALPEGVTSIGHYAFYDCPKITTVTIPSTVTELGLSVFAYCPGLKTINYNAANIESTNSSYPLFGSSGSEDPGISVVVGDSVSSVPSYFMAGAHGVKQVTMGENVTSIGDEAFYGCPITSIAIPSSVETIGYEAFHTCDSLSTINYNAASCTLGPYAFHRSDAAVAERTVVIGDDVVDIPDDIFNDDPNLVSVTLGAKVATIGYSAFAFAKITSLTIPASVKSMGDSCFTNCTSLATIDFSATDCTACGTNVFNSCGPESGVAVTVSDGVLRLPDNIFDGVAHVKSISLPDTLKTIGAAALSGTGITSVIIPDGVTSIGTDAFRGCHALASVTIGEGVEQMGSTAFCDCTALATLAYNAVDASFGDNVFYGDGADFSITFGSKVEKIPEGAFNCGRVTGSIVIPDKVTEIGANAFYQSTGITSVVLGAKVASIGHDAFYGCSGITALTIGSAVQTIGARAFCNCSNVTSLTIPSSVKSIGEEAFHGMTSLSEVEFNANLTEEPNISVFRVAAAGCKVTFGDGVTAVPQRLFGDCNELETVVFNDDLKEIGARAFCNTALTSLVFPDGMTTIGNYAFEGCTGLTTVTIPQSVISITLSFNRLTFIDTNNNHLEQTAENLSGYVFTGEGNGILTMAAYGFTFDTLGGTDVPDRFGIPGTAVTPAVAAPERAHYTFAWWCSDEECTEKYTITDYPDSHVTLYAKWTPDVYTVTFDLDGGSPAVDPVEVEYPGKVSAPEGPFTKTGHTLTSWRNGLEVYDFSLTVDGDITLTAFWTANDYTITLDGNGADHDGAISVKYLGGINNSSSVGYKTGYTLTGYFTQPSGGVMVVTHELDLVLDVEGYINAGGKWIRPENVTLYAQWNPNEFGSALIGGDEYGHATFTFDSATVTGFTPATLAGHTCMGYYTAPDSGTRILSAAGELQPDTDYTDAEGRWDVDEAVNLYAKWEANTVAITLDGNGYGSTDGAATATYASSSINITAAATRPGWTLTGYYSAAVDGDLVLSVNGLLASSTPYTDEECKWTGTDLSATLYAHWDPLTYTVELGGVDTTGFALVRSGDTKFSDIVAPTYRGHHVASYATTDNIPVEIADASGNLLPNVDGFTNSDSQWIYTESDSVELLAQWLSNAYNIVLERNGGLADGTATVDFGSDEAEITLPVARTGYELTGYYIGSIKVIGTDGTLMANVTDYTDSDGYWIRDEGATFTARWNALDYTVTLNKNGGDGENVDVTVTFDSAIVDGYSAISRTGYTLTGYFTAAVDGVKVMNADGTLVFNVANYTDADGWIRAENTVLYAQWDPNSYSVVLDGNGSGALNGSATAVFGSALSDFVTAAREGYAITGYFTAAEDGTKVVNANGTLVADVEGYTDSEGKWILASDVRFYAQWVAESYTVTFNVNGGDPLDEDTLEVTYGQLYTFGDSPSHATKYFAGWMDANDNIYSMSGTWSTANDVTLTAQWHDAVTYEVKFTAGNAEATGQPFSMYVGAGTIQLPDGSGVFALTGNDFTGWSDGVNLYQVGADYQVTGTVTFTAGWQVKSYWVTYRVDGGTVGGDYQPLLHNYGSDVTVLPVFDKPGYDVTAWVTEDVVVTDGGFTMPGNDVVFRATSTAKTYNVTLDKNGGKADGSAVVTFDSSAVASFVTVERTGYILLGYYSGETMVIDAAGALAQNAAGFTADGKWAKAGNATIQAEWQAKSQAIVLDKNGGDADGTATVTFDSSVVTSFTAATRAGNTLNGFFTAASEGTKVMNADGSLVAGIPGYTDAQGRWIDSTFGKLYAQWTAEVYDIDFRNNIDGSIIGHATVAYGATSATITAAPIKAGYAVQYYSVVVSGDRVMEANGSLVAGIPGYTDAQGRWIMTEYVQLGVLWTVIPYALVLDKNGGDTDGSATVYYGNTNVYDRVDVTRAHYDLLGYFTAPEDGVLVLDASSSATYKLHTADGYVDDNHKWCRESGCTLYAHWQLQSHQLTIHYVYADSSQAHYDYEGAITYGGAYNIASPSITGYTPDMPGVSGIMGDDDVVVTVTYTVNQYTITFDSNGGTDVAPITQDYNTAVSAPASPTRDGYAFSEWQKGGVAYQFTTMPAENITLVAAWNTVPYTITYELSGGTNSQSNPASYDIETPTFQFADATRAGYDFGGWYSDSGYTSAVTQVAVGSTGDMTLYAKWAPQSYDLVLDSTGTDGSASVTFDSAAISDLVDAAVTGYNVIGYSTEGGALVIDAERHLVASVEGYTDADGKWVRSQGATLTAVTEIQVHTLTINYEYSAGVPAADPFVGQFQYGQAYSVASPAVTGYSPGDVTVTGTMDVADIVVSVLYTVNTYTVRFDGNGGSPAGVLVDVEYGSPITDVPDDPVREGYVFKGWDPAVPETMPASDITVKAVWSAIPVSPSEEVIEFDDPTAETVVIDLSVPEVVEALNNGSKTEVDLKGDGWTMEIPKSIITGASGNVSASAKTLSEADKEALPAEVKELVKDKTVFSLNLSDSNGAVTFVGSKIRVTLPYELKDGEDPKHVKVFYIDGDKAVGVDTEYDADKGTVTFETDHFSTWFVDVVSDDSGSGGSKIGLIIGIIVGVLVVAAVVTVVVLMKTGKIGGKTA